jgi:NADH dehydrogenase FAD-containing subunit
VVDTVSRIDAAERTVSLANGGTVGYDYLIYAVGSGSADPSVPRAAEYAHSMATLEQAQRLRSVLDTTPTTDVMTVVGACATGIEVAAELAAEGRTVTLVYGKVLHPYLHPRIRRKFAKRLAKLGVSIIDGPGAKVTAVSRDAVPTCPRPVTKRIADGTAAVGWAFSCPPRDGPEGGVQAPPCSPSVGRYPAERPPRGPAAPPLGRQQQGLDEAWTRTHRTGFEYQRPDSGR